jgi:nucleotide-binding universal stress UspA family protein
MMNAKNILLPSHGTEGAQAAERAALAMCTAESTLNHLLVVPDFWKGMMGDDWLNNGSSRDRYARYLESELGKEVDEHISRVKAQAEAKGIKYHCEIVLGSPEQCLTNACDETQYDLVVMGSPRPKGKPGLRSRMATDKISKQISIPVLKVPYPA